jgi:hypothetical protein
MAVRLSNGPPSGAPPIANNHYAGHGPATLALFQKL